MAEREQPAEYAFSIKWRFGEGRCFQMSFLPFRHFSSIFRVILYFELKVWKLV